MFEEEIGTGDWGAFAAKFFVERTPCGWQIVDEQRGAAIDRACVTIVGAHPVGRVGRSQCFKADALRRSFILGMPVEGIVVAPIAIVQKTSGRSEEVESRFALVVCRVEGV